MTKRLLPLFFLALCAQAELVDRIVATVGRKVITASTVRQQLRIAALLERKPVDASPASLEASRQLCANGLGLNSLVIDGDSWPMSNAFRELGELMMS